MSPYLTRKLAAYLGTPPTPVQAVKPRAVQIVPPLPPVSVPLAPESGELATLRAEVARLTAENAALNDFLESLPSPVATPTRRACCKPKQASAVPFPNPASAMRAWLDAAGSGAVPLAGWKRTIAKRFSVAPSFQDEHAQRVAGTAKLAALTSAFNARLAALSAGGSGLHVYDPESRCYILEGK